MPAWYCPICEVGIEIPAETPAAKRICMRCGAILTQARKEIAPPRADPTRRQRLQNLGKGLAAFAFVYLIVGGAFLWTQLRQEDLAPRPSLDDLPTCIRVMRFGDADTRAEAADLLERVFAGLAQHDEKVAAAPELALALGSPWPRAREVAARGLLSLGAEGAKATGSALDSPEVPIRLGAARLLGQMGMGAEPASADLLRAITHETDAEVRAQALQALCAIESVSAARLGPFTGLGVAGALKFANPQEREEALKLILRLGARGTALLGDPPREAVPALLEAFRAQKGSLDGDAAKVLQMISGEAQPATAALLKNEDPEVRRDAARLLATFPMLTREAESALIAAAKDGAETVREAVVLGLQKAKPWTGECVPALLGRLRDASPRVQAAAIRVLGKRPLDDTAAAKLVLALMDGNAEVRKFAAGALSHLAVRTDPPGIAQAVGIRLPELIGALRDPEWSVRLQIARALAWMGTSSAEAAAALSGLLQDSESTVRWAAVDALAMVKPDSPDLMGMLMQGLKADDPTRSRAIGALEKLATAAPACIPVLLEALRDPEPRVRSAAVIVLRAIPEKNRRVLFERFGAAYAVELRETGLTLPPSRESSPAADVAAKARQAGQDPEYRRKVVEMLGSISPATPESVQGLMHALEDEAPIVRGDAADALGRLKAAGRPAASRLVAALVDSSALVREKAAAALEGMAGPELADVTTRLIAALGQGESGVVKSVRNTLVAIGKPAVPGLQEALKDPEDRNRISVLQVLGDMRQADEETVRVLFPLLHDRSSAVRRQAILSLGTMGPAARIAIPAIQERLNDPEPEVRNSARATLERIEGKR